MGLQGLESDGCVHTDYRMAGVQSVVSWDCNE